MVLDSISLPAVASAAVTSFMFGGVWYGALAKPWMAAAGMTPEKIRQASSRQTVPWSFVIAFISQLVMAFVLAGLLAQLGATRLTPGHGMLVATIVWTGFVATTLATNHAFQTLPLALTLIDGAHWLGVLLIQGAIIGWMAA